MTAQRRLTLHAIETAPNRIDPVFLGSPQYACEPLGDTLGCELVLKVETQNPIRSFKGRGASLFVDREAGAEALVCASAGNFGQAMAYACRTHARVLTVYASRHANQLKLDRMRALGAEVVQEGDDFDDAKDAARAHAAAVGARYVEDGHELAISEGAGTLALELLRGAAEFDTLLVPLGNGALLAGVATVARALAPSVRIVAVSAEGAPAMVESLRRGRLVRTTGVDTIADGVAVREPVPAALRDLDGLVDDTCLVPDDAIVAAMRAVHDHAGLVVEPAGAIGVAALVHAPALGRGRRVATILCGGNLTARQRAAWLT